MQVFCKDWFQHHQNKLLWFANTWVGRRILRIHGDRSDVGNRKIIKILPNAITWRLDNAHCQTEFRTHDKFAKRLYYAFKPFWYLLHALDWIALDRTEMLKQFSFGFDTLTAYPDPGAGSTTTDGGVFQSGDDVWATIRAATGNLILANSDPTSYLVYVQINTTPNKWIYLLRSIYTFDTSALTAPANISAAIISFYIVSAATNTLTASDWDVDVYTSTPASNNTLVAADFSQVGTVSQTGSPVLFSDIVTGAYGDFTLNATGIGNISKTGISKFATRSAKCDANGNTPTWDNVHGVAFVKSRYADYAGTSSDPKLVVTYTASPDVTISASVLTAIFSTQTAVASAFYPNLGVGFSLGLDKEVGISTGYFNKDFLGKNKDIVGTFQGVSSDKFLGKNKDIGISYGKINE